MNVMFSIIIPAYNVQTYILECLDSIKNQTISDYEVIIVDDGSTDDTGTICDEYIKNDARFHVYHKKNEGVSKARNTGVDYAKGEYLLFMDGDDYITKTALQGFRDVIIGKNYPDVVLEEGQYYDWGTGKLELSKRFAAEKFGGRNGKQAVSYLLKGKPMWAAFAKCFKKSFWNEYQFKFRVGMTCAEDIDLVYKVIYKAKNVEMVNASSYCYRCRREGSAMQSINKKKMMDIFATMERWETFFIENHIDNHIKYGMRREFGNLYRNFILFRLLYIDKEDILLLKPYLQKNINYLFYCKNSYMAVYGKIFGIDKLIHICNKYIERKHNKGCV